MTGSMDLYETADRKNISHTNENVSISVYPDGFEFRFIYEGVLLTCVSMFGLVSNIIAVIVLLRYDLVTFGSDTI